MKIEKSKNAKEAIEFFRTLFKGDVVIDGIYVSEDTIQELIMEKLDIIEKAIESKITPKSVSIQHFSDYQEGGYNECTDEYEPGYWVDDVEVYCPTCGYNFHKNFCFIDEIVDCCPKCSQHLNWDNLDDKFKNKNKEDH